MASLVFVGSVWVSAFLLFLLQPMLARVLLPVFGGSPAVWNSCMVFFQLLLLAGYAYAHGSLRRLGLARQRWVHGALLLLSLLALPRALGTFFWRDAAPIASILVALTMMAGAPFFMLSTNSSLTQRWFSLTGREGSSDPFWLYAASNIGSLVALLAYPLIVEPLVGVRTQLRLWSWGYALFVALSFESMWLTRHATLDPKPADQTDVDARRKAGWVIRAAIASSLLLSITMQIATDVFSAPLFWVLPLALYLVTFIVAFSSVRRPARERLAYATMIGIALCFVLAIIPTLFPLWFALLALLGTLFLGALLCHGDLADDRPAVSGLTDFYLWIAVGGAIGGVANSIVAPLVFRSVVEYPVTLVALAWVASVGASRQHASTRWNPWPALRTRLRELATSVPAWLMVVVSATASAIIVYARSAGVTLAGSGILHWQFVPVAVLIVGVLYARRDDHFVLASALSAAFLIAGLHFLDPIIDQGRSFFGVSRVTENADERIMIHGVTVHGSQRSDSASRDIPTSYYYPASPLGWPIANAPAGAQIGVIGLGAGSLAALTRPGQHITYFEIDPLVETMARRDFTYLHDAKASLSIQIGDGRRLIAAEPDAHFDLLLLDAFNSDAIPTHLLTEEALALYLRKLKPDGLLIVHISNRYADLSRVFRGWRVETGQRVAIDQYVPSPQLQELGVRPTVAVALARTPNALLRLAATRQWFWIDDDGPAVHWTDDHVNLLAVLNGNMLRP